MKGNTVVTKNKLKNNTHNTPHHKPIPFLLISTIFFPEASLWSDALFGLERNWVGNPGLQNLAIPRTLNLLQEAAALATAGGGDDKEDEEEVLGWRGLMYLKRAYYDAYIQVLTHHATSRFVFHASCLRRSLFF